MHKVEPLSRQGAARQPERKETARSHPQVLEAALEYREGEAEEHVALADFVAATCLLYTSPSPRD